MMKSDDGRFWGLVRALKSVHDERHRLENEVVAEPVKIVPPKKKRKKRKKRKS